MMDSVFAVLEEAVIRTSMTGDPLPARGNTDPLGAPWDAFPTVDNRWVMVCGVGADKFYEIYQAIGRPDIAEDYKGYDQEDIERRSRDLDIINAAFAEWTQTKTAEQVVDFCTKVRIPSGMVRDVNDLLADPQILAREMAVEVEHPQLGPVKTFNLPIKFFGAEAGITSHNAPMDPALGEHSGDILEEMLGMSPSEVAWLKESGVI